MSKLLLGLDAGNTVVKAVLFDRSGKVVARYAPTTKPADIERDIEKLL